MKQVGGPVVAVALILAAVFIPTAAIPGITGRLYQQFAITIAISVLISAFNALTLSPALAALLLKPRDPNRKRSLLQRFFDWFNNFFSRTTDELRPHLQRPHPQVRSRHARPRRHRSARCLHGGQAAYRLPPAGRPGLHVRRSATPRRLQPAAHRRRRTEDHQGTASDTRHRRRRRRQRLLAPHTHAKHQHGLLLRHAQAMGPAQVA